MITDYDVNMMIKSYDIKFRGWIYNLSAIVHKAPNKN